jgi:peptidyl-prolyl cis-trans isomerase D
MLRDIRKASANWLGKVVMGVVVGFLIISFAIWGVGDIFRGFGRSTVATIGGTEITIEQFRQVYNERLQRLSAQVGRPIPPDQVRAAGLDRQILGQVIADVALDQRARALGLGVTDDEVARQIRDMSVFQGAGGAFDHQLFLQRIRSAGYTEPRFVSERRQFMVRQQLTDSVSALATLPKTVLDVANRFQNERRSINYVLLGAAQAGEIAQPTPEQLETYFNARKVTFRAPEYRKIVVVTLMPDDVRKWITVSDEDAKRAYDSRSGAYVTPGRRHVQQIIFPSEDEARTIKERIDAGATFEDIAKARGMEEKDIDLGFVTRSALAPDVAEAAFSLPEGGVSNPVKARIGTALVRVLKIEADKVRPFDEVKDEIKQAIALDRARDEVTTKHNTIEDERAGGQTLAEAAQKAGLSATTIEAVDRAGRDPTGAPVRDLPPGVDVLAPAFTTDVGVETDPLRVGENGYLWFEVAGITPPRDRTLEEVKDRVEERWRNDQISERLQAKTTEIMDKIKAGTSFADVAAAEGLKVESAAELRRNTAAPGLSTASVTAVYGTAKGGIGTAEGQSGAERVIFQVTDVSVPSLEAEDPQFKQVEETLRNSFSEDLLRQYVNELERELGAKINTDALRRVVGGEGP